MRMVMAGAMSRRNFYLALTLLTGCVLLAPRVVSARPEPPRATDQQIVLFVTRTMEAMHLSRHSVDDEMAQRCFDSYVKMLDPWKLYFYQSDIDEFMASRDQIDDMLKKKDVSLAYTVFNRFLDRNAERAATALKWVDAEHDFTVDEEMVSDRDAAVYATSPEDADKRWRQRVKFDLLSLLADDTELEEAKTKLRKRYGSLQKRWEQTSRDELLEIFLSSLTTGFDPHSSYMSAESVENFQIQMKLELDGIGASLRAVDGYTEVHEIIPGGAADLDSRLKKGDQIVGVGQGPDGEIDDIVDMKLNDVVNRIRGKRDTVVRMEVKPVDNPKQTVVYAITRARIELKNQEARGEVVEWGSRPNGQPYRVGVVQLPSFYMDMDGARLRLPNYKSVTRDVRRLLNDFNKQEVDMVMVDLRFNGGGSLTEAVNLTGLFIDKGPVVQVKGTDGRSQPYDDPEPGMVWSGPLVVVTNKFSASASEIFAGAIQDYHRGIVIGDDATHGKGTVQQLFDLGNAIFGLNNQPNLGSLKLTIQQFYRPGGDSTQNRGVLADVIIPHLTSHLDGISESDLDYAMKFDQVRPLGHDQYDMVDSSLIDQLRQLSAERIKGSEDFARDLKRIERYKEQKEQKTVTLNKEKYLAQREELDAEKEQEEAYSEIDDPKRPVFKLDHYGKEALTIAIDYLLGLKENRVAVAR
ncbi:MAG: carboxy terminal-processing peptidase [Pirellulales bacterium]